MRVAPLGNDAIFLIPEGQIVFGGGFLLRTLNLANGVRGFWSLASSSM